MSRLLCAYKWRNRKEAAKSNEDANVGANTGIFGAGKIRNSGLAKGGIGQIGEKVSRTEQSKVGWADTSGWSITARLKS